MKASGSNDNGRSGGRNSFKIIGLLVVVVAIGLAVVWLKVVRGGESTVAAMATAVVERGPLTISVLETGTIKSRDQRIIKNEVEGRTTIVWLIPEGSQVKEGDLLVQLDASTMDDDRIEQEIRTQNAEAAYINAKETLTVAENQAVSDVNVAELTLEFAIQDLDQYKVGMFPNELTAAQSEIDLAKEELTRAEETLTWSKRLYEEKYISLTELQADQLAVSRGKNKVKLAENDLELLKDFTYKREIKQRQSDVHQAEMALVRARAKSRADVIQARADLNAKEQEYERQKVKLAKLLDQIAKAEVRAPADGMAIYATTAKRGGWRDNREPMDVGVEVYERQELIYLPTTASAMAEVDIHEASLEKVHVGLPAVVTVDALPGQKFIGEVAKISPLPDPQSMWMNPDLKVYNSDIYLEGEDEDLRTGMSCKVEIIVEQHNDALSVPIQCVIRIDGQPTVLVVKEDGTTEQRRVEIGLDNNRKVQILSGLKEGELVSLTPPLQEATIDSKSETEEDGRFNSDEIQRRIEQSRRVTPNQDKKQDNDQPQDSEDSRPDGPAGQGPGQGDRPIGGPRPQGPGRSQ